MLNSSILKLLKHSVYAISARIKSSQEGKRKVCLASFSSFREKSDQIVS